MGAKGGKDPLKAPKKPVAARVGAAMNKKLQAKFASTQSKILKSLAKEVIDEVGESPDSKHPTDSRQLTTHKSDLDISAIKPQDMTLSADSKAMPSAVGSPTAEGQKKFRQTQKTETGPASTDVECCSSAFCPVRKGYKLGSAS